MKFCDIKGCKECISEIFHSSLSRSKWVEVRACQCGSYKENKVCTCIESLEPSIPTTYWPNLDWFALGGVEKVTLCPKHKVEVFDEIIKQRALDPSMNSEVRNRGNVH
jgi:hypothetical protein